MIRHLGRLAQPVGRGSSMLALSVYGEPDGEGWRYPPACDQGFEGVACVDDAARAAIALLRLETRFGNDSYRPLADGLLAFVRSMQGTDGRFLNFITNWDGQPNATGPTSVLGGPWSARAVHALAVASVIRDDGDLEAHARRGLGAVDGSDENLDVHAVIALAALELWRRTGSTDDARLCLDICDTIAAGSVGGVLRDRVASAEVHLWGHLQEAALASAGVLLGRPALVGLARRSADRLLLPALDRLRGGASQAFDVSCVATGLAAVATATGEGRYYDGAGLARGWFLGRNAAARPVYDQARGVVFDGVDEQRVSANAGAESNIEGANALLGLVLPFATQAEAGAVRCWGSRKGAATPQDLR